MKFPILSTYIESLNCKHRYVDVWGGRGRGGSYYITQAALMRLMFPSYFRGYFVRQTFGDIRESLWRDLMDRIDEMEDIGQIDRTEFNISDGKMRITHLPTGNMIVSKGVYKTGQRTAKLKSLAGATHVFMEEANEINEDDFNQLDDSLRKVGTPVQIFRCFNPPEKAHWMWRDYLLTPSEIDGYMVATCTNQQILSIFSTYRDNVLNINAETVRRWEDYKRTNTEHYYTVICGLVSEGKRGRIFRNWKPITDVEFDAIDRPTVYGLDFGYSNDPTALVAVKLYNNERYYKELIYETALDDQALFERINTLGIGDSIIIADTGGGGTLRIANLRRGFGNGGLNIRSAIKGQGSVNAGIQLIQGRDVHVTESSRNIWHEYNSYTWGITAQKELTDTPVDKYNHAIDAVRYVELSSRTL